MRRPRREPLRRTSVQLPAADLSVLDTLAIRNRRSVSAEIRIAIEERLQRLGYPTARPAVEPVEVAS